MRRLIWSPDAAENLIAIRGYIDQFSPLAAQRLAHRLVTTAESLAEFPERGRSIAPGGREITLIQPYIIRYAVDAAEVIILRIRHGARRPD